LSVTPSSEEQRDGHRQAGEEQEGATGKGADKANPDQDAAGQP